MEKTEALSIIDKASESDVLRICEMVPIYWAEGDCKAAYENYLNRMTSEEIEDFIKKYEKVIAHLSEDIDEYLLAGILSMKEQLKIGS